KPCNDSDSEDALDAFMAGIEKQVETQKNREGPKIVREDYESEDQHEELYKFLQQKKVEEVSMLKDMEAEIEYDSDDNPIVVTREILPLPPLDHESISYMDFNKNFYCEHETIKALSNEEVKQFRSKMSMRVSGLDPPRPVCSFAHFGFDDRLMRQIIKMGFTEPTAIQAQAIPAALSGRDVIGIAKTGSGKTCSFLWPMLVHINDQPELPMEEGPIGLICAPTRELAQQIFVEAKRFSSCYGFRVVAVYGGDSKYEQTKSLKDGAEIVVATPGRLIDHAKTLKQNFSFFRVTFLVLDEADRMFDLGFEPQVKSIVQNTRPDRQTMLFSATFKGKVEKLARECLTDPVRIVIGDVGEANEDVTQHVHIFQEPALKWTWLTENIVSFLSEGSVLIFVNKKVHCEELTNNLKSSGYEVCCLHGDMDQVNRNLVLNEFKKNKIPLLVATDVAARGLDIPLIKIVVNYDVARDIDTHTHRIGRTGRAGSKGTAHTLLTPKDEVFAGHLVRNLEGANQIVPTELLELAKKNPRFLKSRSHGKNKSGVGRFGARSHLGIGMKDTDQVVLKKQKKKKADFVSFGTSRSQVMAQFKSTFVSGSHLTNIDTEVISRCEEKERQRKAKKEEENGKVKGERQLDSAYKRRRFH
ncbi:hypothetical protein Zmor_003888, partial [Zophobas morio]